MLVVRVRDVAERDRNSGLLHLRDVGECGAREQPIEPWKARLVELVGDRLAIEIVHRRAAAPDGGIHVFPSEQAEVAVVAARFVGQEVGPRARIASADAAALAAMDRETDKVSLGKVPRRSVRRRCVRCQRFIEFRRTCAEDLCDIPGRACPCILENDVRQRHRAEITAGTRVRHPRRGRFLGCRCPRSPCSGEDRPEAFPYRRPDRSNT